MIKKKNNGSGSQGFTPKVGQTKKMCCTYCLKYYKKQWTWHTWVEGGWFSDSRWECNSH